MQVESFEFTLRNEQKTNNKTFNEVLDRLFLIVKHDSSIRTNRDLEQVEKNIKALKKELQSKLKLLKKAKDLISLFEEKIEEKQASNLTNKTRLLDNLGGDF